MTSFDSPTSQNDHSNKRRIRSFFSRIDFNAILVIAAIIMMVTAIALVATGPDKLSDTQKANNVCQDHGGVVSINAGRHTDDSVVCGDRIARDLNG